MQPSEQLTHGQHGPAEGLRVLIYAMSPVSHHGEPMDWVVDYGKGRVYTTMLGHTWKGEAKPGLHEPHFCALLARGAEWAATGKVHACLPKGHDAVWLGMRCFPHRLSIAVALHELLKPTANFGQELRAGPEKHEASPAKPAVEPGKS
jgi:hypothetical protein